MPSPSGRGGDVSRAETKKPASFETGFPLDGHRLPSLYRKDRMPLGRAGDKGLSLGQISRGGQSPKGGGGAEPHECSTSTTLTCQL